MEPASFKASAPGSIMLLGEHSVLQGSRALCTAVNRRATVLLRRQPERRISIESALGQMETSLDNPEYNGKFDFILRAVARISDRIEHGIAIEIETEMPATVGLGSSAAVTVAACAAARALAGLDSSPGLVMDDAVSVVRAVQGKASGADCAASAWGGAVGYRVDPFECVPLDKDYPLTLVYCGYKRKTADVIEMVARRRRRFPEGFNKLDELVGLTVSEGLAAFSEGNWQRLGFLMDFNHGLMESMGVANRDLARSVHILRSQDGVLGAKISGSGLGDCAVALGKPSDDVDLGGERIDIGIDRKGVVVEEA